MTDCISSSLFYKAAFTEAFLYHFFSFRFWKSSTEISIQDLDMSGSDLTITKDLPLFFYFPVDTLKKNLLIPFFFVFLLQQHSENLDAANYFT